MTTALSVSTRVSRKSDWLLKGRLTRFARRSVCEILDGFLASSFTSEVDLMSLISGVLEMLSTP